MLKQGKLNTNKLIILFSSILIFFISSFIIYQEKINYESKVETSRHNAQLMVDMLSNYIELTYKNTDLLMKKIIVKDYDLLVDSKKNKEILEALKEEAAYISSAFIINKNGQVESVVYKDETLKDIVSKTSDFSEEFFYKYHKQKDNKKSKINSFEISDSKNYVIITSRINKNNEFYGILGVLIDGQHFTEFFKSIGSNSKAEMVILQNEGLISAVSYGSKYQKFEEVLKQGQIYLNHSIDKITIIEKFIENHLDILAFKKLQKLQVSVVVILHKEDILESWIASTVNYFILLFVSIFCYLIFWIYTNIIIQRINKTKDSTSLVNHHYFTNSVIYNLISSIKMPINSIIGFSEVSYLEYLGSLSNYQKEKIKEINLLANNALDTVNNLLNITNNSSGKIELSEDIFKINSIIKKSCYLVEKKENLNNIKIIIDKTIDTIPAIKADGYKLCIILTNLLSFIMKFTDKNGEIVFSAIIDKGLKLRITSKNLLLSDGNSDKISELQLLLQDNITMERVQKYDLNIALCCILLELHNAYMGINISSETESFEIEIIFPKLRLVNG